VNTWQESLRKAIKSQRELNHFFQTEFAETPYPIFLPLKLAEKIRSLGLDSPLAKQFLPHKDELVSGGLVDPIGDHRHSPTPMIVHRYESRALFLPTNRCPIICRYCFRKNELYETQDPLFKPELTVALEYLTTHTEINEVIFSGGDPFMLSNEKLSEYLSQLEKIPHLKYLRFHTRFGVLVPERFDDELIQILKKAQTHFDKLMIVIHTNHPAEWDEENLQLVQNLVAAGFDLRTQSVLLKGVNDDPQVLVDLFAPLIKRGLTPYYLHHPDQVKGAQHFRLTLQTGRQIYSQLRRKLPGWAMPRYMVDLPEGEGKVEAFNPEAFEFSGQLINQYGRLVNYENIRESL